MKKVASTEIKSVFDWVKAVTESKQPWSSYTEDEKKLWNQYMVFKCLSMYEDYIDIINILQGYWNWEPERLYKCLCNLLPQQKIWYKYIKSSSPKYNPQLVKHFATYFEISEYKVKEYLRILSKAEQKEILDKIGLDDELIKDIL